MTPARLALATAALFLVGLATWLLSADVGEPVQADPVRIRPTAAVPLDQILPPPAAPPAAASAEADPVEPDVPEIVLRERMVEPAENLGWDEPEIDQILELAARARRAPTDASRAAALQDLEDLIGARNLAQLRAVEGLLP